jgi:hypothetical protein
MTFLGLRQRSQVQSPSQDGQLAVDGSVGDALFLPSVDVLLDQRRGELRGLERSEERLQVLVDHDGAPIDALAVDLVVPLDVLQQFAHRYLGRNGKGAQVAVDDGMREIIFGLLFGAVDGFVVVFPLAGPRVRSQVDADKPGALSAVDDLSSHKSLPLRFPMVKGRQTVGSTAPAVAAASQQPV